MFLVMAAMILLRGEERQAADMENKINERELLDRQTKNPFSLKVHKKLSDYYVEKGRFEEAENQQEILEYLGRIKRMCKR